MTNNKLQLNEGNTDEILISPRKVLNNVPFPSEIRPNDTNIKLSQTVRNLGVTPDQAVSFQQHILNVCRTCCLEFRRISIRHNLSKDATKTLMCAFVLFRLDYCSALLSGFRKFKTLLQLGSSIGLPNLVMPYLFPIPYISVAKGSILNPLHYALNF